MELSPQPALLSNPIKLTQYSHGAGCGCKISPEVLDQILHTNISLPDNDKLLVGNNSKDDAAVYDLGNGSALISTTDFFMPIVDDPYDFGRIASANAISDVYAMGGTPILAIAILGWPVDKLAPDVARKVIEGSRSICREAGISLAGGHSIDSPEPIFGLAVNGLVEIAHLKQNNTAREGDLLLLTKPVGVGILTTAEKKGILKEKDRDVAARQMMQLNIIGKELGKMSGVHAMTDVTGFGVLGHLIEMCEGSNLSSEIFADKIPLITPDLSEYILQKCIPGGTQRNWQSYGGKVSSISGEKQAFLADPQTSGGLLIAIDPAAYNQIKEIFKNNGLENYSSPIGRLLKKDQITVNVIA